MLDWVQVQALAGPLKDTHRLDPKPLLCCLGCVLRVIVLLDGEPLPQSEVLLQFGKWHCVRFSKDGSQSVMGYRGSRVVCQALA